MALDKAVETIVDHKKRSQEYLLGRKSGGEFDWFNMVRDLLGEFNRPLKDLLGEK